MKRNADGIQRKPSLPHAVVNLGNMRRRSLSLSLFGHQSGGRAINHDQNTSTQRPTLAMLYTQRASPPKVFYVSEMQKSIAEVFGQAGIFRSNVNAVCIEEQHCQSGLAVCMV